MKNLMSEVKGVIPKIIVLIISLILIYAVGMPTPTQIGITLIEAIDKSFPHYMNTLAIVVLRLSGWIFLALDILSIYIQARRGEYF